MVCCGTSWGRPATSLQICGPERVLRAAADGDKTLRLGIYFRHGLDVVAQAIGDAFEATAVEAGAAMAERQAEEESFGMHIIDGACARR